VVVYNRTDGNTAPRTATSRSWSPSKAPEECTPQDFRLVYQHDGTRVLRRRGGAPLVVTFDEPVEAASSA
jgi:hypothetical protein